MADIRCSHCGKDNPDFLDVCQFCQSPLTSEAMLHIGQKPTKKDTGELEGVLPDWLKNARQQSRDSAEEDAAYAAAQPKPQKDEPVDLLAGLFQSDSSEDEDIPDWLSSINPNAKDKPAAAVPVQPEPETDFFAQFNKSDSGTKSEIAREAPSTPQSEPQQPANESVGRDELSAWFAQASEQPADAFDIEHDPSQASSDWGIENQSSFGAEATPPPAAEEDLSWLHNLETASKQTDDLSSRKPTATDWERNFGADAQSSDQDDLSWLNNLGALPGTEQKPVQPAQPSQAQEDLSWLDSLGGTSSTAASDASDDDLGWLNKLGGTPAEQTPAQPPSPQEDLSWLNAFKGTTESAPPATPSQPSDDRDLNWLNDLGAEPTEPASVQASEPQQDLSWLNAFSETSRPAEPAPSQASASEDLSWLNNLGGTPPEQTPAQADTPQEDLSWLNAFSERQESSQAASAQPSAQDDLSWLNSLQGGENDRLSAPPFEQPAEDENLLDVPHVSAFMPRKTAPLEEGSVESMPDWLKSASEGPSMPMGTSALEQFREDYKIPTTPEEPFSWKSFTQEAKPAQDEPPLSSFFPSPSVPKAESLGEDKPEPAFVDPSLFSTGSSPSVPSTEDVNSLFSIDMPDWLSQAEPAKEEDTEPIGIHAEGGEALAPVDLPSWVQAMRPVDAVISESVTSIDDQPAESEGPLAGLRGVIPSMPVGSARRPKAISLKLQATDEQQTSAGILEQLLASETSARSLVSTPAYAPQRTLRQVLAVLFVLVLGAVLFMRSQIFAISPPTQFGEVTNAIQGIPDRSNVLVVIDYEPALAGEMEAVSGPLLDQLALLRQPRFSFISTSPSGPALVERLMSNTNINASTGQEYFNLGFLPGAESGVLTFLQSPGVASPAAPVTAFADYAAVIVLTDHADSARIWIEQLQNEKQRNGALALQPLLVASSAQSGPLLQPYVSSRQVNGLITGLADASRFEFMNNSRPGIARSYWDAFGVGLIMAVGLIVLGSLWSILAGIRARRAEVAEG